MKFSFAAYSRELKTPFVYGEKSITKREGVCLRLESDGGPLYSEASPLPGHSSETLEEVMAVLPKLSAEYCAAIVADDDDPADFFPPSLIFGLEGMRAQKKWSISGGRALRSNALVAWSGIEKTLESIWALKAKGYSTIKFKVLEGHTGEMLEVLSALEGKGIQVRLDANRSLSEGSLKSFLRGLEKFSPVLVDYLEEPFAHWRHPLLEKSPVPLAADECAADPKFWRALLGLKSGPTVFVLKPTVSGGLFSLAEKSKRLLEAGKRVVYSSALEAEPGRRGLLSFLSSEGIQATSGTSTGFLFKDNFLEDAPLRETIPGPSADELSWLENLNWRPVP